MTTNKTILILTTFAAFTAASCARNETAAKPEEPVRESAWRPAGEMGAAPAAAPANAPAAAPAAAPKPAPTQAAAPAPRPTPKPGPAPMKVTLDAGTTIPVRIGESITSENSTSGDSWSGTLAQPLVVDGLVIADRGARVDGTVTNVKRAGRVKGVAQLSIAMSRLHTADGQVIDIPTSSFAVAGKDETKKDAAKIGIASGVGAAIGAIAGRGKGAAIGAGAGAAAGTGVVLASRGGAAVINNEALVNFRVSAPVTITEKIK